MAMFQYRFIWPLEIFNIFNALGGWINRRICLHYSQHQPKRGILYKIISGFFAELEVHDTILFHFHAREVWVLLRIPWGEYKYRSLLCIFFDICDYVVFNSLNNFRANININTHHRRKSWLIHNFVLIVYRGEWSQIFCFYGFCYCIAWIIIITIVLCIV